MEYRGPRVRSAPSTRSSGLVWSGLVAMDDGAGHTSMWSCLLSRLSGGWAHALVMNTATIDPDGLVWSGGHGRWSRTYEHVELSLVSVVGRLGPCTCCDEHGHNRSRFPNHAFKLDPGLAAGLQVQQLQKLLQTHFGAMRQNASSYYVQHSVRHVPK
jgi:hypothetical protein